MSQAGLTVPAYAGSLARTLGLTNQITCLATSRSSLASSAAPAFSLSQLRPPWHHRPKLPQFLQRLRNRTLVSLQSRRLGSASGAHPSTQPLHCGMSSPVARSWSSLSQNRVRSKGQVCFGQAGMWSWIKPPLSISTSALPSSHLITNPSCQLEHTHSHLCGASSEA